MTASSADFPGLLFGLSPDGGPQTLATEPLLGPSPADLAEDAPRSALAQRVAPTAQREVSPVAVADRQHDVPATPSTTGPGATAPASRSAARDGVPLAAVTQSPAGEAPEQRGSERVAREPLGASLSERFAARASEPGPVAASPRQPTPAPLAALGATQSSERRLSITAVPSATVAVAGPRSVDEERAEVGRGSARTAAEPRIAQPTRTPTPRPSAAPLARLIWPASGPITTWFGEWGALSPRGHAGVDISAPAGAPVAAAAAGAVDVATRDGGYGIYAVVDHGNDTRTLYAHLSQLLVQSGQRVERGQIIGRVGSTGLSTGPHLHFEVRVGGVPRDPIGYLR